MSDVIHSVNRNVVDDATRKQLFKELIENFEDQDCDTLYECADEDETFAEAYKALHPEYTTD